MDSEIFGGVVAFRTPPTPNNDQDQGTDELGHTRASMQKLKFRMSLDSIKLDSLPVIYEQQDQSLDPREVFRGLLFIQKLHIQQTQQQQPQQNPLPKKDIPKRKRSSSMTM